MKTIVQAMLEEIYLQANKVARGEVPENAQVLHVTNLKQLQGSYFITLKQLEEILQVFES